MFFWKALMIQETKKDETQGLPDKPEGWLFTKIPAFVNILVSCE